MTQISNAIATRDNGPEAIVRQHKDDLTLVLPSHVKGETWMRLAYGVLRSNTQLMQVATRNPGSLMTALQDCARLGHEPASKSFYLVPFGNEIQGIEGYRGVVERIYRAGAVKVVHAEVVYENDEFVWEPGTVDTHQPPRWEGPQTVPFHRADWFADRGEVKGAFSYGIFQDGTPSRVVIINRTYINKVRKESKGSESPKSPWVKWFDQMVLKTVAHRLEPWVPTSTEWRKEQLRATAEVTAEQAGPAVITPPASTGPGYPEPTSPEDFNDDTPIEGELVD
ncbi:recombinase RecT [Streptomyces olivaceus]|uniref:recombinase RecT n=1 Tax=Streptomyces olivaceus TaxID=47716 RepID=UPI001CCB4ECD|nr:recombinase RecT [Streptomyces olivaceus]MBZ6207464.1 recombinase RecT [Streptomyces olivaceus]